MPPSRPKFDDLPLNKGDPPFSAWGLYGKDDNLGTLNLLTPEVVLEAAKEIKTGVRVGLDFPVNYLAHPTHGRKEFTHNILWKKPRAVHDDEVSFNTQVSSQWDGFAHYGYQQEMLWYNGKTQPQISGSETKGAVGIDAWCAQGIVGRGVLLDYYAWRIKGGKPYEVLSTHAITVEELKACAEAQGTEIKQGDVLFVRSGWAAVYETLSEQQKLDWCGMSPTAWAGVKTCLDTVRWLWETGFSAVAGDAGGFEQIPFPDNAEGLGKYHLHEILLGGWGMPIGEIFNLERLSEECAKQKRYSFFLASVPLNVPNGCASPPNIVAVF